MLLVSHGSYQNYNALMASWNKQTGPVTFMLNYTFSKVLGIRDGESDNGAGNGFAWIPGTSTVTTAYCRTITPASSTPRIQFTCPSMSMATTSWRGWPTAG